MAQTLFDAFTGNISVENQAALVVQSLLDAQNVAETAQQVEEEDLFQCGKCKKQFTTLQSFIGHKQERCSPPAPLRPLPQQPVSVPSNTASFQPAVQQQQQHHNNRQVSVAPLTPVAQSPLTQLSSGMVQLSDDIMAFTSIDPSLQTHTIQMTFPTVQQGGTVQGNPFLSQAIAPRASNANSVTIYSPVQSASFSSNGSAFTSTVPSNQIQVQSQPVTLVPAASIEKSAQPKPSPTKAGRKSAQSMNQQFITVSELSTPQKGKKGKVVTDAENASKRKMRCQYCSKTFNKNFDLQQHLRCHTGEKPFQCIVCGRAFAQKSNVKKHMTTHKVWPAGNDSTLPKPFNPPVVVVEDVVAGITQCNSTMTEETQEAEHNPQPIRELNIGSSTDGNGQQKLVVDNSYLCQYCPEKFKSYFQLKSHMITHKSEQVYKCVLKTCGLTFKNLDAYLEHMKTHEEGMTYRCHLCNKKFPSLYDLGVHQYTHSLYPSQSRACGPRYYQCTLCMNKYASPEALDHHLSTASHHHECPTCLKVFTCERYLRRHLITHGTFGQYQCSVCLRRFKAESYLKMHVLIHTGVKPFKCEQCNAAFNRKDKLKRHMLIHDAIKKFKCPFRSLTGCEMEFNRPDKLKAHIISHSGIKPYKCRECGKAFSRKSSLGEHESCHRAEFKFRCEKCGKGFFRPKLFHGHRCNPLVDKDGALIVPPTRLRSKRKVGRPRKRMITVTPDTIKSVSTVLTRRRARSRRDAAQAAVAESKEKVNSEGTSKDESVKKVLKTEMEPQRAQNQVIPTESPAPANNTELISVPDSNTVTSRENYTPQDESLQAGPGQTNSDPVTNAHTEVDYHQAVTSAGYTTHAVPVHSYTLSSQHNSVQHHQHNLRSSEVADMVTLSAAEAISHDHNMAAAHTGLAMSEMPHVEIVQLSAAEVMPKTSQQGEMEIELSNSAGDGPVVMGTAQPEYHLVTSQGAGDGQVTRRVLFTSGDVITCVAEIQGPGHMTEPTQLLETGQIQRYVSDVDPVLQGTESMLRASQEILRSAENQSSNV